MRNHIIILGGDGFCGWPTSLALSKAGYDITIIDNLSRRKIDIDLECDSLTPIKPISTRLEVWESNTGNTINFINLDVAQQYNKLLGIIKNIKPKAVVHFAEQRSAPFSMKSSYHKRYTVDNNTSATTHNIITQFIIYIA